MEKNIFKNVCICVTESLSCTAEMNTTLCINYTSVKRMLKLKKKSIILSSWHHMLFGEWGVQSKRKTGFLVYVVTFYQVQSRQRL